MTFWKSIIPSALRKQKQLKSRSVLNTSLLTNSRSCDQSDDDYHSLARSAFVGNVIANRAINMIAKSASAVDILLYKKDGDGRLCEVKEHAALYLIKRPAVTMSGIQFRENLFLYQMLSGNAYVYLAGNASNYELQLLRPDRVVIRSDGITMRYVYTINKNSYSFPVNQDGFSRVLHFKNFHPLDDWYGLSNVSPARQAIAQHNKCVAWNKALLDNGARPSGAIVMKANSHNPLASAITDEQFDRLKAEINDQLSGDSNAGRVMVLEGGLEWQDMSISPRDMDFIETKNSAARDIALAIGVPSQMLGIPGDNTYSNMSEARMAFWEETIVPLLSKFCDALSTWLSYHYREELYLQYDPDDMWALNEKRQMLWDNITKADFLSTEEKREVLGFGSLSRQFMGKHKATMQVKVQNTKTPD